MHKSVLHVLFDKVVHIAHEENDFWTPSYNFVHDHYFQQK